MLLSPKDEEAWLREAPAAGTAIPRGATRPGRGTRTISKKLRFQVLRRDSFRCTYCGRGAPEVVLHVDHVVARSLGGETAIGNLWTACADCNLGKGVRRV